LRSLCLSVLLVLIIVTILFFFFFFQAEDGIRDRNVTGVQTCALPIFRPLRPVAAVFPHMRPSWTLTGLGRALLAVSRYRPRRRRSEERRVGKECRSRWEAG